MATNKRKEAAALFELIDKSTLKVPKHAGALKIPDWWSSKTNPAPPPPPPPPPLPTPPSAPPAAPAASSGRAIPPAAGTAVGRVGEAEVATGKASVGASAVSAQPRLFDPPPADARPTATPSIRPPGLSSPLPKASVPSASAPAEVVAAKEGAGVVETAAPRRQFRPQTMEQGDDMPPQWGGQQRRRMARTPRWAVIAGGLCILVVVLLMVYVGLALKNHGSSKWVEPVGAEQGSSSSDNGTALVGPARGPLESGGSGHSLLPQSPLPAPVQPGESSQQPAEAPEGEGPVTPGKVFGPGTVARSPELYYIMISSTPTHAVAEKSAAFLAQHGVDVSIEIVASANGKSRWYKLISVRGFPTVVEAEPFLKEIVKIGHEHPDFKKYRKVWDDAFATHVVSVGK